MTSDLADPDGRGCSGKAGHAGLEGGQVAELARATRVDGTHAKLVGLPRLQFSPLGLALLGEGEWRRDSHKYYSDAMYIDTSKLHQHTQHTVDWEIFTSKIFRVKIFRVK